ncbi:MAG: J domain-containing protein [Chthonomonas sp.]|nr:J domain-containing protein [Chthonomonas sp.]
MSEFQRAVGIIKGYVNQQWERINSVEILDARDELDSISPRPEPTTTPKVIVRDAAHARRILDVAEGASLQTVKKAYEELREKSKPEQFTTGSEEHTRAIRIQRSIHTAYTILSEEFSITEKRFQSLEID